MAKAAPKKQFKVHFDPDNVDITVAGGANLLETAIAAGVHVYASCGGAGTCGTCKVQVKKGEVETTRTKKLSQAEYDQGIRQACQSRVTGDVSVYLPVESRLEKAVLTRESQRAAEALATGWRFKPPLGKCCLELTPPSLKDNASDLSRLLRGLKQQCGLSNLWVDFEVVRKLPRVLRDGKWKVTVTTLVTAAKPRGGEARRPRVINVAPGDTRDRHYALAFDIGTTTVCGQLLDLNRARVVAEGISLNGQISYGADVISRIAQSQKPGGLKRLQRAVVDTMNGVIGELLERGQVKTEHIGHVIAAGNTTMTQLLVGIDPKYIRLAPYVPAANFLPPVEASSLGIKVRPQVYLFTFPSVASYVGGDIVAGVVGSGIHQRKKLTLFMDIGTNGEIVVGNSDWMVTASCSAGPTFEGGGVKYGMIAADGAIQDVDINPGSLEPKVHTIGDARPRGICGSGLINTVAGLLEAGIIGQDGSFHTGLPTKRVRQGEDGHEYLLAPAKDTQIGKDIVITEVDIDNLMRAKAAMYAGWQTLVRSVGFTVADLEQVIVAGAFGNSLDVEKAITIGLLPDLPRERFVFVGNGSLLGARLTSFSTDVLDDARRVAKMMTNFELSENVDFMNNYVAALFLPHTDASEFPTVARKLAKLPGSGAKGRVKV